MDAEAPVHWLNSHEAEQLDSIRTRRFPLGYRIKLRDTSMIPEARSEQFSVDRSWFQWRKRFEFTIFQGFKSESWGTRLDDAKFSF